MSSVTIGGTTLTEQDTPVIKASFEYFKSKSGVIIGGNTIYTISGTITVPDSSSSGGGGSLTGATVMSKLASIRQIGRSSECVSVNIPGFYSGRAKISNVSIEQGPDSSWVNQGAYTIEVKAPLSTLPPNDLGITVNDYVTDISISEAIEIGEDAHGFRDGEFTKTFVKFTNKISVTCQPLCPTSQSPSTLAMAVIRRLVRNGPQNPAFSSYQSWQTLLQDRSLEISNNGSVSFSSTLILLPSSSTYMALVDLNFGYSRDYSDNVKTKSIGGTITGLAPVSWGELVNLGDSCASKFANAEAAFGAIKGRYNTLGSWTGIAAELALQANCPNPTTVTGQCGTTSAANLCVEPMTSTISKNRTEGSISFNFEWSTSDTDNCNNGTKTEIIVDVEDPQPTLVEHTIIGYGTLIQNLNCATPKRVSGTLTITSNNGGCPTPASCNTGGADLMTEIGRHLNGAATFYQVGNTETTTLSSYSLKLDYVGAC